MKTINAGKLFAFGSALLPAPAAFAGLIVSAPVDVIGNLPAAQFAGLGYGTNTYKDWGNEPFVAVNPTNTNDVFISSLRTAPTRQALAPMSFTRRLAEQAGRRNSPCRRHRTG